MIKGFKYGVLLSVLGCNVAYATTSTIDTTQPQTKSKIVSSVLRNNFTAAANDINSLWVSLGSAIISATDAGNLTSGTLDAARLPAFSGDISTPLGSSVTTLATVNTNVGTFGSASKTTTFTVNSKGLITASSQQDIAIGTANISGLAPSAIIDTTNASNITSGTLSSTIFPAFSGDISTSIGSTLTTLATVNSSPGSYGSSTQSVVLTVDAKGRLTATSSTTITPAWSSITSTPTTLSGYGITDALSNTSTITPGGPIGSSNIVPIITYNATGQLTTVGTALITPSDIGAPTTVGTGATGTWDISITGNASTVTTNANLSGDVSSVGNTTTIGNLKVTNGMLAGSITNDKLTNSSITIGSTTISLGSSTNTLDDIIIGSTTAAAGTFTSVSSPNFTATGTGANTIPVGTTGERPSGVEGLFRDNTTLQAFEAYINGGWQLLVSSSDGLVPLTSKVSGVLPTTNGGTGLSTIGSVGQALVVGTTGLEYGNVSGSPGGTDGQIQYNNSGVFGGLAVGSSLSTADSTLDIAQCVGRTVSQATGEIEPTDKGCFINYDYTTTGTFTSESASSTGLTAGFGTVFNNKSDYSVEYTPDSCTINGSASFTFPAHTGCYIYSDGTNFQIDESSCSSLFGTIVFQDSDGVSITGGSLTGVSISSSTLSYVTVSEGDLNLGTNSLALSGSIGSTSVRSLKGWFTDLDVTNTITGSVSGNAATVTTNANLTGDVTSVGNASSYNNVVPTTKGGTGLSTIGSTGQALIVGTSGLEYGTPSLPSSTYAKTVGVTIDGGGSEITTGVKGYYQVPFSGTITGYSLQADQSGSAVIDVWNASGSIPTVTDTITASAKPTLSAAQYGYSTTLTDWTTSVTAGDVIGFNVDSASTITRLTVQIYITAN